MYWIEAHSSGWLKMVKMVKTAWQQIGTVFGTLGPFGASCPPFHPRRDSTKTCSGRRGLFVINIEQVHAVACFRVEELALTGTEIRQRSCCRLVKGGTTGMWLHLNNSVSTAAHGSASSQLSHRTPSWWAVELSTSQRDCFEHFLNSWSYKSCPALARCP